MKIPEKYKSSYEAFCDRYNISRTDEWNFKVIGEDEISITVNVSNYMVMLFKDAYSSYEINNFVQL